MDFNQPRTTIPFPSSLPLACIEKSATAYSASSAQLLGNICVAALLPVVYFPFCFNGRFPCSSSSAKPQNNSNGDLERFRSAKMIRTMADRPAYTHKHTQLSEHIVLNGKSENFALTLNGFGEANERCSSLSLTLEITSG